MRLADLLETARIKPGRLASELGITPGAISQWDKVPSGRVLEVERITGIPRHVIRPDIYPPEREATAWGRGLPSP